LINGGTTWSVAGTGDYNGDGKTDILWTNSASGMVVENLMNGSTVLSSTLISGGTTWKPIAS
jgi:hypothetical protein